MDFQEGYHACLEGSAYRIIPEGGYLAITGADWIDFLQRQTTNDLRALTDGTLITTVLTSPVARILDVFQVFSGLSGLHNSRVQETGVQTLTLPGRASSTFRYLNSRIFFMDRVDVANLSHMYVQVDLLGPQSGSLLAGYGYESKPDAGWVSSINFQGQVLTLLRMDRGIGLGYRLLLPAGLLEPLGQRLVADGSVPIDQDTHQLIRIERGIPGEHGELTEEYTPLEVGYQSSVSPNKGCYVGQEVLARQVTYDKITRKLCGLKLDEPVGTGTQLLGNNNPVGVITSIVESPRFGIIALAVVKRPYHEVGTILDLHPAGAGDVQAGGKAVVSSLPFSV